MAAEEVPMVLGGKEQGHAWITALNPCKLTLLFRTQMFDLLAILLRSDFNGDLLSRSV